MVQVASQATLVVVASVLLVGCGSAAEPATERVADAATAKVTCPDGHVNSGTVDYASGSSGSDNVSQHAAQWAKATDLTATFPSARLTVLEEEQTVTARFTDATGEIRAELSYGKAAQGWALEGLVYC